MLMLIDALKLAPYKAVVRYKKDLLATNFTDPDENGKGGNFIRRGYASDLIYYIEDGRVPNGVVVNVTVSDGWDGGLPQPCFVIEDNT
jgi:hypothetical protein